MIEQHSDSFSLPVFVSPDCPEENILVAFNRGDLDFDKIDEVSRHLGSCAACQKKLSLLAGDEFSIKLRSTLDGNTGSLLAREALRGLPKNLASRITDRIEISQNHRLTPDDPALAGRYQLTKNLGSGQFGSVYKALDLLKDKNVAIKITAEDLTRLPKAAERFLRDVESSRSWNHRYVVKIFDHGIWRKDQCFVVMELIRGERLDQWLTRKRRPIRHPMHFFGQLMELMRDAHHRHTLHRNLKPSNIFLTNVYPNRKEIRVADFGLFPDRRYIDGQPGYSREFFRFQAPEQLDLEQPVDQTADIFSLGKLLKFFANNCYFPGDVEDPPQSLKEIIDACTADNPADRIQSVCQLRDSIDRAKFWTEE